MAGAMAGKPGPGVFVPARQIPAPPTVSAQAQQLLANPPEFAGKPLPQDPRDAAAWRAHIAESDQWLLARMQAAATLPGMTS